jgi:ABC-type Fe3+-siderophore transport system permease subunit
VSSAVAVAGRASLTRAPLAFGALAVALAAAALADLMLGPAGVAPADALRYLFAPDGSLESEFVQAVRLPRAVAGAAAGAALGVSGVLLQVAVRNALAEPWTIGVNAGATLAVTVAAVVGFSLGPLTTVPVALVGGLLAAALVLSLARVGDPLRLVLAGVAVTLALSALAEMLRLTLENQDAGLFLWGAGSIEQTGWDAVRLLAPAVPVLVFATALLGRDLDALALGDDAAESLGIPAGRTRLVAIAAAVLLAAVAVALAGPIAFVGLAAPHVARRLGIDRHRGRVLGAALAGAALLLGADAVALALGGEGLTAGVVATICGAPLLIAAARRVPVHPSPVALRSPARRRRRRLGPVAGVTVAAVALLIALVGALAIGELMIGPADVVNGLFGRGQWSFVIWELRLPRALVAAVAGAALGICGLILQGTARNPLAAPEILGVTGGASIAAVTLLLFVEASPEVIAVAGFAGGVTALALVAALAPRDLDPARVALIGVAVAAASAGIVHVLLFNAGLQYTHGAIFLVGSTYAEGWADLAPLVPLVAVAGTLGWVLARRLDAIASGDDVAAALGVPPVRTRLVLIALAALLAAGAVATVGAVGFVGLMAPHLARVLVGPGHRISLPVAAACGATILLLADLVGRSIMPEAREIPSGLVTAMIGAPLILVLLRSR